jgi:hypothetical protein
MQALARQHPRSGTPTATLSGATEEVTMNRRITTMIQIGLFAALPLGTAFAQAQADNPPMGSSDIPSGSKLNVNPNTPAPSDTNKLDEANKLSDTNKLDEANKLNDTNKLDEANKLDQANKLNDTNKPSDTEQNKMNEEKPSGTMEKSTTETTTHKKTTKHKKSSEKSPDTNP